jgi:hypothetical protein
VIFGLKVSLGDLGGMFGGLAITPSIARLSR